MSRLGAISYKNVFGFVALATGLGAVLVIVAMPPLQHADELIHGKHYPLMNSGVDTIYTSVDLPKVVQQTGEATHIVPGNVQLKQGARVEGEASLKDMARLLTTSARAAPVLSPLEAFAPLPQFNATTCPSTVNRNGSCVHANNKLACLPLRKV